MDTSRQLGELIDLAESLGISIRQAPSPADSAAEGRCSGGALVRLKGKEIIFLDSNASLSDQITVVAGALRLRPEIQQRFLPPEIRQLIDQQSDGGDE